MYYTKIHGMQCNVRKLRKRRGSSSEVHGNLGEGRRTSEGRAGLLNRRLRIAVQGTRNLNPYPDVPTQGLAGLLPSGNQNYKRNRRTLVQFHHLVP
ncbi:unnamed protein product, partial [Nesidiocoris tenuis]